MYAAKPINSIKKNTPPAMAVAAGERSLWANAVQANKRVAIGVAANLTAKCNFGDRFMRGSSWGNRRVQQACRELKSGMSHCQNILPSRFPERFFEAAIPHP